MTFYLAHGMRLEREEMCVECAWGSTYSNDRMRLHATYTSWNEEYAQDYLAKQAEYIREMTTIDGNRAKIQSWRGELAFIFQLWILIETSFYESPKRT